MGCAPYEASGRRRHDCVFGARIVTILTYLVDISQARAYSLYILLHGGQYRGRGVCPLKKKAVWLWCLLPLLLLSGCGFLPSEEELAPLSVLDKEKQKAFEFSYVTRGDLELWENIDCKFQSLKEEQLSFPYGGRPIGRVSVEVGDEVKPGQLLAQLENKELDEALEDCEDQAKLLKQRLQYARRSLDIIYSSWDLYDQAEEHEDKVEELEEDSAVADKRLEELKAQKREESLYAGIGGTVAYVGEEELSDADVPFITVSDQSKACFYADTEYGEAIKPGTKVTLTTQEGELLAVVKSGEELGLETPKSGENGKSRVYFVPEGETAVLHDSSRARLSLMLDSRRDVLIVSERSVLFADGQAYVFYENEDGVLTPKPVELGLRVRGRYEVLSGLNEGEALLVT